MNAGLKSSTRWARSTKGRSPRNHWGRPLPVDIAGSMQGQDGSLNAGYADRFADAFGLDIAMFEAPNKPSQFAFLEHFGQQVQLCNVRLEELLRVEIFRRGLHSDAFAIPKLQPAQLNRETM